MRELFPAKQVVGFIASLVLTVIALLVYFIDMSFQLGMIILLLTAFTQAGLQLVVFMHAGESPDSDSIYVNTYYGIFIALAIVFGSLLAMVWGY
ncbi:cytochrome aa3 quinol oxidase subunit IV [Salimicrobium sp. PL1-032A]|uniref:Quinol oxidase subunit 4 n=1 Tax=Salimicrobium halophilum TaxID=86666 RepID=A0A1G8TV11_9BACI|nr:cytochrome aa3 quinol oxidase subunit IV [Salimicrobium halophilum]SDJ45329.1 cytochrome aa3-600 menaquinol oxidase subunit 4 [Salimicrobium halophilum]